MAIAGVEPPVTVRCSQAFADEAPGIRSIVNTADNQTLYYSVIKTSPHHGRNLHLRVERQNTVPYPTAVLSGKALGERLGFELSLVSREEVLSFQVMRLNAVIVYQENIGIIPQEQPA
jgi:hypothetical protein